MRHYKLIKTTPPPFFPFIVFQFLFLLLFLYRAKTKLSITRIVSLAPEASDAWETLNSPSPPQDSLPVPVESNGGAGRAAGGGGGVDREMWAVGCRGPAKVSHGSPRRHPDLPADTDGLLMDAALPHHHPLRPPRLQVGFSAVLMPTQPNFTSNVYYFPSNRLCFISLQTVT